ncbi:hypothetical protein GALMADRAFT_237826 [Galerina marginata CBS 339.88]|uniref:MYND-type domain-containing protein n=1 Tax=Galerina marginata (strain CBS 339.88) TaxID=685588 RepID=A0A067TJL8_GALM3|nr:hypothetical protein GALMADRAFT_237826 [Galerina marginata CBS 339.88]
MNWLALPQFQKSLFPNPKRIKDVRRVMSKACHFCTKGEDTTSKFHVCAKCKEIPYCSRECQKAHWPRHKITCVPPTGLIDFPKVCQTLMANDFLLFCFEMLLVNEFDLVNKPWRPGSEPLQVQIILDVEPCATADLLKLFSTKAKIDSRVIQGMLQVCFVVSKNSSELEFKSDLLSIQNYPIERYAEEFGLGKEPYVSITFLRVVDGKTQIATSAFVVHQPAIETCRELKKLVVPAPPGSGVEGDSILLPMSTFACIELINGLIQHDSSNDWLMRMNMRERDKQAIKDAAAARPDQLIRLMVKKKILNRIKVAKTGSYA